MYQYKIFVLPDPDAEELSLHSEPTLADAKATISLLAEMSVKRLLEAGVRHEDLSCVTGMEEPDCFAVFFEWAYPTCKGHTHEAMVSARLVMA